MNRRHFFGMTLAAVAAAGLPALVLPDRSIFLPPRLGWFRAPLHYREIRQYLINQDATPTRFDVLYEDTWGEKRQYFLDFPEVTGLEQLQNPSIWDHQRDIAVETFERIRKDEGLRYSSEKLALPGHGAEFARIWTV